MTTPALKLDIKPSRWLLSFSVLLHTLAFTALWLSAAAIYWQVLLSILVVVSGVYYWTIWRKSWRELSFYDDIWQLADANQRYQARPAQELYISPWLLVMYFVLENGRRTSVVLLPDSADRHQQRRLRVMLNFSAGSTDTL